MKILKLEIENYKFSMNIIFLTKYFPPDSIGGGEISAYYLALGLAGKGHQITVIKRGKKNRDYNESKNLKILERKKLFTAEVPNFERRWAKKQAQILIQDIPRDTQIIHSHDFHSALIGAELKKIIPCHPLFIATVRDYWPVCGYGKVKINGEVCPGCKNFRDFKDCPKVARGNLIQKYLRMWRYHYNIPQRQESLKQLDEVIYISQALRDEIKKSRNISFPFSAKKVIYNSIPLEIENYTSGSNAEGKTILFAGLLDLHKGVEFLLKALSKIALKADFQCILAGTGPLFEKYKKMAKYLRIEDKVNFLGAIPYRLMPDLYRKADLVVMPSLWPEPFGRTALEGMAYGKAVVSTRHGAPQEFIQNNETGILIEPGNVLELAERIIFLLQNPDERRRIGENARKDVLEKFHPAKIAEEYEKVYQYNE
ncbi:MAG: glycosyltransferase family 4 protein [Patescibacteria group bacterium]|nr:glycosyltransferase family 4 protein [Patescibacteria group bacterium]